MTKPSKASRTRPKARATSVRPPEPAAAAPPPFVPAPSPAAPVARLAGKRPPRARASAPPPSPPSPPSPPEVRFGQIPDDLTGPMIENAPLDDPMRATGELEIPDTWVTLQEGPSLGESQTGDDVRVPAEDAQGSEPPAPEPAQPPDVEAEIREIEARLDELLRQSGRPREPARRPGARALVPSDRDDGSEAGLFGTASRLLSTDYYLRQWGRMGMRTRAEEVDEFGLDHVFEARVLPLLEFLYRRYFRVVASGVANIPSEGACLLVANHSGTVPFDGPMMRVAVQHEHPARREVRWLAEDLIYHFPFLGAFASRIGAVRACQENAERLLRGDRLVAVFPEGIKGISKLFRQRYKLQRFGRGGYVKLALRTGAPIVPVSIVGGEETAPMLYRVQYLARALGLPYIPITPTFPLLGPFGLLPAPTKWSIRFGRALRFDGHSVDDADDPIVVNRLNERVLATIQEMVDHDVAARGSVFFG